MPSIPFIKLPVVLYYQPNSLLNQLSTRYEIVVQVSRKIVLAASLIVYHSPSMDSRCMEGVTYSARVSRVTLHFFLWAAYG